MPLTKVHALILWSYNPRGERNERHYTLFYRRIPAKQNG